MKPFSFFGLTDKFRRQPKRKPIRRPTALDRLLVEELETRTVMSTIPAATPGVPQLLTNNANALFNDAPAVTGINAQAAMNPRNHNQIIEVNDFSVADLQFEPVPPSPIPGYNDVPNSFLDARYSNDGGVTWYAFNGNAADGNSASVYDVGGLMGFIENNLEDPKDSTSKAFVEFTNVSSPSITFDSNNNVYVIFTESNADATSGEVLLSEYNFSGSKPSIVYEDHVLYAWQGSDAAYNPVVKADTNQPTYTDPTTGAVQTDPLAGKALYVAWNVNYAEPTPLATGEPPTESKIVVEGSADGVNFSPPELVTAPQHFGAIGDVFDPVSTVGDGAQPQIVFTQGTATLPGNTPRIPGGEMVMVWNGSELESVNGTLAWVYDQIDVNVSQPIQVANKSYASQQPSIGNPAQYYNLSDAGTGSASLTFLSQYSVATGTALEAQYGTFFFDQPTNNDQGHDLVSINGTTITTLEINNGAVIRPKVTTALTSLPGFAGVQPIAFTVGNFFDSVPLEETWGMALIDFRGGQYFLDILACSYGGTFSLANSYALTSFSMATALTTNFFVGSGHLDIAVAGVSSTGNGQVQVFVGDGLGDFAAATPSPSSDTPASAVPVSISSGSFNQLNNGATPVFDLVVANQGPSAATQEVDILTNKGGGNFNAPFGTNSNGTSGVLAGLGNPVQVIAGDFFATGAQEVAILYANGTAKLAFTVGDGTFQLPSTIVPIPTQAGAVSITAGSFNGSKLLDVASVDNSGNITVSTAGAGFSFSPGGQLSTNVGNGPVALATANLFNNAFSDLTAVSSGNTPNVTFFQGSNKGPGVTTFSFTVSETDPTFVLDDLTVALNLIDSNLANLEVDLVPPAAIQNLLSDAGALPYILLIDSTNDINGDPTKLSVTGQNLGVSAYAAPSMTNPEFFVPTGPTLFDSTTGTFINNVGGTVFDAVAARSILDKGATSPFIDTFQPVDFMYATLHGVPSSLETLLSLPAADRTGGPSSLLNGTWSIRVTDFNPPASSSSPPEHLYSYGVTLTSAINTTGFGQLPAGQVNNLATETYGNLNGIATPTAGSPYQGNFNNTYLGTATDVGGSGVGPGLAVAIDNTLGSYSPYEGRIYVAYNGYGNLLNTEPLGEPPTLPSPDVFLMYSDTGGIVPQGDILAQAWQHSQSTNDSLDPVTDDSANSNFSEGDRPKFDPSLTVDPVTGTLVVTYYDGRFDPAGIRTVNTIQESIDGGQTFSAGSFLNVPNDATDFFSGTTSMIEPVPGNAPQSTSGGGFAGGFGDRPSAVLAYDGRALVVFATNLNSGYGVDQATVAGEFEDDYTTGASVYSTSATFAAGPRIVSGDQGPVTQEGNVTVNNQKVTYNDTFAADGTRQLSSFVIVFDRPVNPQDLLRAGAIQVMYHSPNSPASVPGTAVAVGSVTPLDVGANFGPGLPVGNPLATTFLITLAVPQSAVGTYSYMIAPVVHDEIRSKQLGSATENDGNAMDQNADGTAGESTDFFANPKPLNGVPFELPYDSNTEPLIIPGPHVIYTYTQYQAAPTISEVDAIENGTMQQTDNVVVDNTVSSIFVLFDRDMNPNTFAYPNNPILSFIGPNGPITSFYRVIPGTSISGIAGTALQHRIFEVEFLKQAPTSNPANDVLNPQALSGSYTLQFAATATDTSTPANAVDTNLNAGLYVLRGSDPTNAATVTTTYTNPTPVTIIPGKVVFSTISVPDAYIIEQELTNKQDIQVQLNINYPTDTDLQAALIAPNGTVIQLFTNVGQFNSGNGGTGFDNSIFDDSANTPIQLASVPFDTGPFNPQKPLSVLDGDGSEGTWKLAITDTNASAAAGVKQLTYWTLRLPHEIPGTGLGESVADQFSASFRIFTQAPTNAVSSNSYTAIGPASANGLLYDSKTQKYDIVAPNADAGQVNAIAIDPSDPSGNTVYAGGGNGGVWKTTDFLTGGSNAVTAGTSQGEQNGQKATNPNGPTWVPLTDFGPTNSLNISNIAIAPVNNDPNQSVIFAMTGNASIYGEDGFPSNPSAEPFDAGIGLLRSTDGGKTWVVLDGLNNVGSNGKILPIQNSSRDHTFDGDVGFQVAIDPHETATGFVVYAAFSGPTGGLYRSTDSGNTWTLIQSGNATAVVLAPASVDANNHIETLYAAFQSTSAGSSGVYMTTSAFSTHSLSLMSGAEGVNVRVNFSTNQPIPVSNDNVNPNGQSGRIVLATPALTNNPLENIFYQQYLYAAVINGSGSLVGLYMTKDAGNNWTVVNLAAYHHTLGGANSPFFQAPYGTNDTNSASYDPTNQPLGLPMGNYDIALAIDPTNPNIVYLGGTNTTFSLGGENTSANAPLSGLVRIDTTKLFDAYSEVGYQNDKPNGGAIEFSSPGSVTEGTQAVGYSFVAGNDQLYFNGNVNTAGAATNGFANGVIDAYNRNPYPLPEYSSIASAVTSSYTNTTARTIIPGQTITSSIDITDSYLILQSLLNNLDIQVKVNVSYPTDQDLQLALVAPNGQKIMLSQNEGGSGSGFNNTTFDDGALTPISQGTAPFSGTYVPDSPLSVLNGQNSDSTVPFSDSNSWKLEITDSNGNPVNGTAQLNSWSLSFPHQATSSNYSNLFRDPNNPFVNPSSLQFVNVASFTNTGVGALMSGFNYFVDNSTNYHTLVTMTDPTTGETRLIVGDDQGIFTGLDNGSGGANPGPIGPGINSAAAVVGTRNGNLQLAQFTSGTAQPSTLAADVTGALYYATGSHTGSPQSTADILSTGNITWTTDYGAYLNAQSTITQASYSTSFPGSGQHIVTDATGTGTLYQFRLPGSIDQLPFVPTDFFEVTPVVNGNQLQAITSRTTGLLQAGDVPVNLGVTGQWGNQQGFNFAVNPVDPSGVVISSNNGDIFRSSGATTGYGVQWFEIGKGSQFDGSNAEALAFGAPDPAQPNILDNFIYAGTVKGHIYVTFNGGGNWTNISANLDGSAVEQIVTDPTRGSHDAYAVTQQGVYYMKDATAPNAMWVKLNDTSGQGGLFSLMRGNFNNSADQMTTLQYLTSIVADWRYAIPNVPGDAAAGTHPVLYVAGNGGVFRSLDQGKTWTYYPDVSSDNAIDEGGNLPNTVVTGLTLIAGDVNPASGFTNSSSGLNQLVVTTYGRGDFAIRLDGSAKVNGVPISQYLNQPNSGPSVSSISEIVPIPGTALTGIQVKFSGPVDPQSFTTSSLLLLKSPSGASLLAGAKIVNVTPAPTSGQGSPPSIFDIIFATPQTATGNYTISIGTGVTDFSGNPLSAAFTGSLFFTPDTAPSLVPSTVGDQIIAPGDMETLTFTTKSALYPGQVTVETPAQVSVAGPGSTPLTIQTTQPNSAGVFTVKIQVPSTPEKVSVTLTVMDPQTLTTSVTFNVIVDVAPTFPETNPYIISLPHTQFPPPPVTLSGNSSVGLPLTYSAGSANTDSLLYDLQQQYQFVGQSYATYGATAYVLKSPISNSFHNQFYLIRPSDGAVFAYDGSGSYAHSFANGSPITSIYGVPAVLGANVFNDPTLLLKAQAPIDYTTLYDLEQQYGFTPSGYANFGAAAYVLKASTNNSFGNKYYLLRSTDGALFPYDGSGGPDAYKHTFDNVTPVQINGGSAILGANVYNNPALLFNAGATPTIYQQLYQLNQQYDLQELNGSFYTNTDGHQAQWLYSPVLNQFGQHWYTLTLQTVNAQQQAVLTAWEGYADSEVGAVVADLDPSVYSHPAWLTSATAAPNLPPGTVSIDPNTGQLSINGLTSSFVGAFTVNVTVFDGLLPASLTVFVQSTDAAPSSVTVQQNSVTVPAGGSVSFSHSTLSQGPSFSLSASDTDSGDTVTLGTPVISAFSPYTVDLKYHFTGVGYATFGAKGYSLTSPVTNSYGNTSYLLDTNGNLYQYDGSGSYAHTFNNGANLIASFGASVYNDPSLLTNAEAPVDYSTLFNLMQQYGFQPSGYANAGAAAYVLKAASNNSHGNPYYLLAPNGGLYSFDGSSSYTTTFNNPANFIAQLDPYVYVNPNVLFGATAAPQEYTKLQAYELTYDLTGVGYAVFGAPAYVLKAPTNNANGNLYYLLDTNGDLYAYDGSGSYAHTFNNNANYITTLDPSIFTNPSLLTGAKAPLAPTGVVASPPTGSPGNPASGTFTVTSPTSFVGSFTVTVSATDSAGVKTTQSFQVNSTDGVPLPTSIPAQTVSLSAGGTLTVPLSATDADDSASSLTYTAKTVGYSAAYTLEQQYKFVGMGNATSGGISAYVLAVNGKNINGSPYFLLTSNGNLYAYDGVSYSSTVNAGPPNSSLIATLGAAVYNNPTLLTNAQPPTPPGITPTINGTPGHYSLSLNASSLPVGTVFQVLLTVSDGAESTTESFLVTVTP